MEENNTYTKQSDAAVLADGSAEPNTCQVIDDPGSGDQADGVREASRQGHEYQDVSYPGGSYAEDSCRQDNIQNTAGDCPGGGFQNNVYQSDGRTNNDYQNNAYINDGRTTNDYQNNAHLNDGWTNNSYQNNAYQNGAYRSDSNQNGGWQNGSYQNDGWQNNTYQNDSWQNGGYQNNGYQNGTYSGGVYPQYSGIQPGPNGQLELEEPVKVGEWVLSMLLMMVPCVNIIMMFVWAFSNTEKKSKSNFFKAYLIFCGISLGVMILIWIAIVVFALMLG